jgi:hypothetical protein
MGHPMKRTLAILPGLLAATIVLVPARAPASVPLGTAVPDRAPPKALRTVWILDKDALAALGIGRPSRLAYDAEGRLHVLDAASGRAVTLDGDGRLLHAVGGYGADEGSFRLPIDLAVDRNQSLLVLDRGDAQIVAFDRDGRLLGARALGEAVGDEGHESNARLLFDRFGALWILAPRGRDLIRLDEHLAPSRPGRTLAPEESLRAPRAASFVGGGDVWVFDAGVHALRRFSASGRLAATRPLSGPLADADVSDIACDPAGSIFLADRSGQRVVVFDAAGAFLFERALGGGTVPWRPDALALGPGDHLAVADAERRELQVLVIERGEGRP